MAKMTNITAATRAEDQSIFVPTPISKHFSCLLVHLAAMIEAERDIENVCHWDVAFRGWVRDAERKLARVNKSIDAVLGFSLERSADKSMRIVTLAFKSLLATEEPEGFQKLYHVLTQNSSLFRRDGLSAFDRRVDLLLRTAYARLEELASLADFSMTEETIEDF